MNLAQRLRAWVPAMRKAGGLAFCNASESARLRVADIEASTPEDRWPSFVTARNRILAMNALIVGLAGGYRLHFDATVSRIVALLSLQLMAKAPDTRRELAKALEDTAHASPTAKAKQSDKQASRELSTDEMIRELATYSGLMFGLDSSPMRQYWEEVMGSPGGRNPGPIEVEPLQLLEMNGEAFQRALKHYVKSMVASGPAPGNMLELLANVLMDNYLPKADFSYDDLILPPLDGIFEEEEKIEGLFDRSTLVRRLISRSHARYYYDGLLEALESPERFTTTAPVILSYVRWLYPADERDPGEIRLAAMSFRPWEHYYAWGPDEEPPTA
jgi:hypothetical protein